MLLAGGRAVENRNQTALPQIIAFVAKAGVHWVKTTFVSTKLRAFATEVRSIRLV
jgi:hypothetical protein